MVDLRSLHLDNYPVVEPSERLFIMEFNLLFPLLEKGLLAKRGVIEIRDPMNQYRLTPK